MADRLVSVCIASIGRASLLRTIAGARACALPAGFALEIVVADDSLDGAVAALVAGIEDRSGLHLVTSAAKNISLARNACMAHSTGEYIVFIDDDEVPGSEWLTGLVQLAEERGADAVQGCVVGIYPNDAPEWAAEVRPFDKTYGETGSRIEVGSTCNLLFRRASLQTRALEFSPAYGKSGGEDTDLCFRLTRTGGVILCSQTAVVYEEVPIERLDRRHLVRRYARGGHTYAKVVLTQRNRLRKSIEFVRAVGLAFAYSLIAVATVKIRPATSVRSAIRLAGNVGKLFFFLGLPAWKMY